MIIYVVMIAAVTLIITIICWISSVFVNCNIIFLFILFLLYGLSIIALSFVAVPFFEKAEIAGNVMSLAAAALGFLYMAVTYTRDFSSRAGTVSAVPSWSQWLLALLSPVAFTLTLDQVPMPYSLTVQSLRVSA